MGRAVVIGGSLAGSLCARVLADHFDEVVLVDRDRGLPGAEGPRRAVPQGKHLHALWHSGLRAMEELLPGLIDHLVANGAVPGDAGYDFGWWRLGRRRAPVRLGTASLAMTRPFLEASVRARLAELPGVEVRIARVEALSATRGVVDGVLLGAPGDVADPGGGATGEATRERLGASLVVDCSGRASQLGSWLSELGYAPPAPQQVSMELGYGTRLFRRVHGETLVDGTTGLTSLVAAPAHRRGVTVLAVEGDRWIVTVAGHADDRPSPDEHEFMARCQGEGIEPLDRLLDQAEPLSAVVPYRMPASIRRDFQKMARFPEGLLVAGDAVASFNPVYGQGMSCAAFHALALRSHLRSGGGSPAGYLRQVKKITDRAWTLSVTEDFRLPTTKGRRPPGTAVTHWLGDRYAKGVLDDAGLHRRFLRVAAMETGPVSLLAPAAVTALWRSARGNGGPARPDAAHPGGAARPPVT